MAAIVEKTAKFAAKYGAPFEARIYEKEVLEARNPNFQFLDSNDAYHAFYQHKISEAKKGRAGTSCIKF